MSSFEMIYPRENERERIGAHNKDDKWGGLLRRSWTFLEGRGKKRVKTWKKKLNRKKKKLGIDILENISLSSSSHFEKPLCPLPSPHLPQSTPQNLPNQHNSSLPLPPHPLSSFFAHLRLSSKHEKKFPCPECQKKKRKVVWIDLFVWV